jgi:hypothetical protein
MATWLQRELNADAGQVRCNRWAWLSFEGEVQEAKGAISLAALGIGGYTRANLCFEDLDHLC